MSLTSKADELRRQAASAELVGEVVDRLASLLNENPELREEALAELSHRPTPRKPRTVNPSRPKNSECPRAGLRARVRTWLAKNPGRLFTSADMGKELDVPSKYLSGVVQALGVPAVAKQPRAGGIKGIPFNVYQAPVHLHGVPAHVLNEAVPAG